MTRVLALDTSTDWGGAALLRDDGDGPWVQAELGFQVPDTLSSCLLRRLEWLLAECGWAGNDLDLLVGTVGPGSFTGIRIGLGTLSGLSLALDRPTVGVGTLEAIAEAHGPAESSRLPLLDAGRGEVYFARYDPSQAPPREETAASLGTVADAVGQAACVVIPGPRSPAELPQRLARVSGARLAAPVRALAAAAGTLALLRERGGAGRRPLTPAYLRAPDAKLRSRPS